MEVSNVCAGTEAETVPLRAGADVQPLTCPDGEKYFKWQGKTTSAQYYVNPKGVSTEKGCQWGDGSQPIGNWAPINLGVGQNNGKWLSIFQNSPTTNEKLDFNVKLKGDNLSGSCRYEGGRFYSEAGSNDSGCTVSFCVPDCETPANQSRIGRGPLWGCLLHLLLSRTTGRSPGGARQRSSYNMMSYSCASFLRCILLNCLK